MNFNKKIIIKLISVTIFIEGLAMTPAFFAAYLFHEKGAFNALGLTSVSLILIGVIVAAFTKISDNKKPSTRDGFLITILVWLISSILGCFPYYFSGGSFSFIDSFFESVAGFTTTGCYVIDINVLPKSLLLWKSISHWLGGIGVLILVSTFMPHMKHATHSLIEMDNRVPILEKTSTGVNKNTNFLLKFYVVSTIIEFALLSLSSMGKFDALINTLNTISTSGIAINAGGITAHMTPYVASVITIFSFIGSINFMVIYLLFHNKQKSALKSGELLAYMKIITIASVIIGISLWLNQEYSLLESLGHGIFQTISFSSTSGYSMVDYTAWSSVGKTILVMLVFIGGCTVSSSGSIKVIRVAIAFKLVIRGIYKRIHPHSVKPVLISKKIVSSENAASITVFIMLYFIIYIFGSIFLSIDNLDVETTLSASLAALSNNGTGFGLIGPTGNFSVFSALGKFTSSVLMLAGRLELYPVVILLSKSFWNPDHVNK